MTAALTPNPKWMGFDSNGDPLSGGLLYTYETGTDTPLDTYTTQVGDVANANPVVLDSRGEANVWLASTSLYRMTLKTSAGVTVWGPIDGIGNVFTSANFTFLQFGTGAVTQTGQEKLRQKVNVFDFMSTAQRADYLAGTLTLDMSAAVQAAIDAVCPTVGAATVAGLVEADPRYPMLIQTAINATNSRVAATKLRDWLRLEGFYLVGKTGAGKCVIETTGSQGLKFSGYITTVGVGSGASTIGIQQAISSTLQQTNNQVIEGKIIMASDATANGNVGTVGIWNFGAEESTYGEVYVTADVSQILTKYNDGVNNPGGAFTLTSYQTLKTTSGISTAHWRGHCSLITTASMGPALILQGVVEPTSDNLYIACGGGTAPANGLSIRGNVSMANMHIFMEHFASVDFQSYLIDSKLDMVIGDADNPSALLVVAAGAFVVGRAYRIKVVGTTNFVAIGASANTVGYGFIATGVGSGTGTAYQFTPILSLDMSTSSGLINSDVKIDIQSDAATVNDNVRPIVSTDDYDETTAGSGGLTYSRITAHAAGALGANLYIASNIGTNSGKVLLSGASASPSDPTFQEGMTADHATITGDGTIIDLNSYAWAGAGSFCRANDAARVYWNAATGQFTPTFPGDYEIQVQVLLYNTTNAFTGNTIAELYLVRSSASLGNMTYLVDLTNPSTSNITTGGVYYSLMKGSAIVQLGPLADYVFARVAVGGGAKNVGIKLGTNASTPFVWQTRMEGRSIRSI